MIDNNIDLPNRESEGAIIDWLETCMRWGLRARLPYELRALQGFLFWGGDQWSRVQTDITRRTGRQVEPPPYCETARIVDNQLPIYVRQVITSCVDAMSDFEAVPATPDKDDKAAAALATKVIKMREREDNEDDLREQELLWLIGSGEVLRRTWYNTSKRTPDGLKGDLDSEIVPLFRYVKCPSSADAWPPRWLIEFDARHVDWVKETYGKTVEPENVADQMRGLDELAMNVMANRTNVREEERSSVILKRMYCLPTKKYPKGHVYVWAGGTLLREHDFQGEIFPFVRAYWYPIPGRLYPMSYLEPLLSDQRQLNILLSQLQEIKNRQLRMDILTQGTGEPIVSVLDDKTGQREIRLPSGLQKWEFLRYDANLAAADADYSRIMRNLRDKAGQSEPTLGQVTNRETTATELQLLREAGFAHIGWHMHKFDRYCAKICSHKIQLAKEFFTAARILADVGEGAQSQVEYWFGAELRNTRDVVPISTPKLTPALRRQLRIEAVKSGLMAGPWRDTEGMPDPFIQFAARTALREMGLVEEDEKLAQVFGSYDDLAKLVGEMTQAGHAVRLIQAMQMYIPQLTQAEGAMPGMPPGAAEGMPPGAAEGMPPGAAEGMPPGASLPTIGNPAADPMAAEMSMATAAGATPMDGVAL